MKKPCLVIRGAHCHKEMNYRKACLCLDQICPLGVLVQSNQNRFPLCL